MTTTIIVCETCGFTADEKVRDGISGGEVLAKHVESSAAAHGIQVERFSCLMNCKQPASIAISAPGKTSYVLGRFEPGAEAAEAITEYAAKHRDSETGVVPYREWPQGVKGRFVARLPVIAT